MIIIVHFSVCFLIEIRPQLLYPHVVQMDETKLNIFFSNCFVIELTKLVSFTKLVLSSVLQPLKTQSSAFSLI